MPWKIKKKNETFPNIIYDTQRARLIIFISLSVCDEILFPFILNKFGAILQKII